MNKGNNKEQNKQKSNIGTKRTNSSQQQEKTTSTRNE